MKSLCTIILYLWSFCLVANPLSQADEPIAPSELRAEFAQEPVEQITVEGRTPLSYYKRQFEMAELDFYDMYNALVDEDDFKMYCRKMAITGSRIKRTYCYPQYFFKRYAFETQNAIANTPTRLLVTGQVNNVPTMEDIEFLVQREQEEALAYAEKLVKENPALYQQLIKMKSAENLYLAKKAAANPDRKTKN